MATFQPKKTMHALALEDNTSVAQLWFIGIIEFAGLTISLYGSWKIKIRPPKIDHLELKKRLI